MTFATHAKVQPGASAMFVAMILAAAAGAESPAPLDTVTAFLQDKTGTKLSASASPGTLLYEARRGKPVLAPDGHQLTLAEFSTVRGSADVKCTPQGTHVVLHVTGLIPNGVYTAWLVVFKSPGFNGTLDNVSGIGALGQDPLGNGNIFSADESGEADLIAVNPAGVLTATGGKIGGCWTADEFEVHVVGAYHIDGRAGGIGPGDPGTFVEQFGFQFHQLNRTLGMIRGNGGATLTAGGDPSTPLFDAAKNNPVLAPDGHQVTLGEFRAVQGSMSAKCNKQGTRTRMHLAGLIPNGVYTAWILTFPAAGGDPVAVGALGNDNGLWTNIFVADKDGEADLSAINEAGPLSAVGSVGGCWPSSEARVQIWGAYHLDGATHGSAPGPQGSWVQQFAFEFIR